MFEDLCYRLNIFNLEAVQKFVVKKIAWLGSLLRLTKRDSEKMSEKYKIIGASFSVFFVFENGILMSSTKHIKP